MSELLAAISPAAWLPGVLSAVTHLRGSSALDLIIETDKHGKHVVVFPSRREELIAPSDYEQKLLWIKTSFQLFLARVREFESIRRTSFAG